MSAPLPIARRRTGPLPAAWWAGGIAAGLLAVLVVVGTAVALKGRQRDAQVAESATSSEVTPAAAASLVTRDEFKRLVAGFASKAGASEADVVAALGRPVKTEIRKGTPGTFHPGSRARVQTTGTPDRKVWYYRQRTYDPVVGEDRPDQFTVVLFDGDGPNAKPESVEFH